ncbi:MAG: GNAT family N-acetyltransferase [Terriglobia bacterium]
MPRAQIRLLKTLEEFRACERLQLDVWGSLAVGAELLSVTQKYGGAVVGALVGGRVVGFIYAFLARRHGRLIHWSHMMAVEAGHRDRGLGFRMKQAHRRHALAQGVRSIMWTYDPLQSRNAALNLTRLGARVVEFIPNCYGRFPSAIERGLESDRFVVDWPVAAGSPKARAADREPGSLSYPLVNQTRTNRDGFLVNARIDLRLSASADLLVEIPANTDSMRARAMPLARRWRLESRRIFRHYLAAGYRVAGFLPPSEATRSRCFYLLRRE